MSLQDAIEGLYRAFAGYGLAARIEGSSLSELREAEARLRSAPLRRLSGDALGAFAFRAMTTFGDVNDFRHFLPRIAELLSRDHGVGACDLAVLLGKLEYGAWETWPTAERAAVTTWLAALEAAYLADETWLHLDFDVVVRAARLRGAEAGLVDRCTQTTSPAARASLARAVSDLATRARKRDVTSPTDLALIASADRLRRCFEDGLRAGVYYDLHGGLLDLTGPPFRENPR